MSITLFSHNQDAYEAAVSMLEHSGKAAIIHPTGTGKSFIAFKFCEDRPKQRICWLSPSEYIFQTQKESLIAAGGVVPENIMFLTYAKLRLLSTEEIGALHPDSIVLDEFHRCGAAMWGQGVQRLLSAYPSAPVLGLSATSIRYLDNQRDMAEELFQGNVASEMTLGEAIARGILPAPKYVISVYSYQKELRRYGQRVQHLKNGAAREQAEKYLEALRRSLNKADGLDEIFARHMTDRAGKYLVFCANVRHMDELLSCCGEWFYKVDPAPHIYRAWSDDPQTSDAFAAFKADDSTHLKLLFCIDMLNEGIHVADLSGVILFRPTVSPIVYKQQIGRALTAAGDKKPVIFDVVNNFENLYSIGTIQTEMAQALSGRLGNRECGSLVRERFQIIDEVRESRLLFEALNDTLTVPWDTMFAQAEAYAKVHGHLNVPKRYKTESGHSLGAWIATQRRVRAGYQYGRLTSEQIAKLDSIGMVWEDRLELAWERGFQAAEHYYQEHGDLLVKKDYVTSEGYVLGKWLDNQRMAQTRGVLSQGRVRRLEALGMVWSKFDRLWEEYFQASERYCRKHGHLNIPADYRDGEITLGRWIIEQRRNWRAGRLSEERILRLESLGMIWEPYHAQWESMYAEAASYFQKYGDLNIPSGYKTANGRDLGKWIRRQREAHAKGPTYPPKLAQRLESIGMMWEIENPWELRYRLAKAYHEEHGDLDIPGGYVVQGVWLGKWLNEQKQIYWGRRSGKQLTKEQITRLEAISLCWMDRNQQAWEEQFAEAERYFRENGNLQVPSGYLGQNGKRLDLWLAKQRLLDREGKLSDAQRHRMAAIGI